ncbi:hypothetical protein IE53DRAFT_366183, partial [Violaceomyces palustris]
MSSAPSSHQETLVPSTTLNEKERLEKLLKNRSDQRELEEKNILHKSNLAPCLQATRKELERSQLEDRLEGRLERRPEREDLVQKGILKDQH